MCGFAGEKLAVVFPAIVVRGRAPRLISLPFNEYGGPLALALSQEQYSQVAEALLSLAQDEKCQSVEIRGGVGCEPLTASPACVRHPLYSYATSDLQPKEILWRKALTNEARKGVNSATKAGLRGEVRRGEAAIADPFYKLYLISMKRLGVPPHPRSFFEDLASGFGERLVASWINKDTEIASVLLGLISGERLQIYIIASAPEFWKQRPNDLAHWELITWAVENRIRVFDWGSARYPGQIQFKKKWGGSFHEYSYYLIAPPGSPAAQQIQTVETGSKLMETAAEVWKRVMPLGLSPVIGKPIRKYLTK